MPIPRVVRDALLPAPLAALAAGLALAAGAPRAPYHPHIDPANFRPAVDNPYFPLVPGTTWRFVERAGGRTSDNQVTVTHETKVVLGVACAVVRDVLREKGVVTEDTFDWYAQDKDGNVWYFGEDTRELDGRGHASTAGSWQAGVNGAEPGIIMPGRPVVGAPYRQEYLAGEAEDMGQVVALGETVTVPCGTFRGCLRTREWSPLERGSESKWYARGFGLVRTESSGHEVASLVSVTRP